MSECMRTWKYLKGSEKDFEGAPNDCVLIVKCNSNGMMYHLGDHYNAIAIEQCGDDIIAQREPVTAADVEVVKYDPTKVNIESLVTERGSRYGKFADGAKIMRSLKGVMHNTDGWSRLTDSQREALDMIQHKIGRILNGDPAYDDNWKDIAGYSKLIADELNGEIK